MLSFILQYVYSKPLGKNRFSTLVTLFFLSYSHWSFAHHWSPHPGRYECPEITNAYECARSLEKKIEVPFIRRTSERELEVTLLDGKVRSFIDVKDNPETFLDDETIHYSVLEVTGESRYLVLNRQFREGDAFSLLDRKTGAYHELKGYPVFSPDGKRLLVANTDFAGFSYTVLQIYKVTDKTIELEYKANLGDEWGADWGTDSIAWQSSLIITFTEVTVDCSIYEASPCKKMRLTYGDSGWIISTIQ